VGGNGHDAPPTLQLGNFETSPDAHRSDVVYQEVAIPADAHGATLSFWV